MELGFELSLAGAYVRRGGQRPLSLWVRAAAPVPSRRCDLEGRLVAENLLTGSGRGSLLLARTLRYDLVFEDDARRSWRLSATQRLSLAGRPAGFTVVCGSLRGPAAEHEVELRLDPRTDLRRALESLTLRRR